MIVRRAWPFVLLAFLAACAARGGGDSFVPPSAGQAAASFPARDLGPRDPHRGVTFAVALRFNHQTELDRLVEDLADAGSPRFHHFLTPEQFDARYAPTVEQHRRVLAALRSAGFTIVRTYADRSLVDVAGPTAAVERFFGTAIHDFAQRDYGTRFAAIRPATVPASIAPLVLGVELDSIVHARTADMPDVVRNVIVNGGFEKGLVPWHACGDQPIYHSTAHPKFGRHDLLVGSRSKHSGEVRGLSAACQMVTVPLQATLSVHLYGLTDEAKNASGYQEVGLMSPDGKIVAILRKSRTNGAQWSHESYDLSAYGGRTLNVFFGVVGRGQKAFYDQQYVDGVSLIGTIPTPSPSPSPSPSSSPSESPSPSPSPTATPPAIVAGHDAPLTGPFLGPAGGWWGPGVAKGFDFPVEHGYNGTGTTVAVVILSQVNANDLASFYSANKITKHGTVTQTPVSGGPGSADPTEATLDVEAIAGLSPGANVIVYETPDLSALSVEDAYAAALSAGKNNRAQVVDTSFGQCESEDHVYDATTNADAEQGAAIGMTFIAASGDLGAGCYNGASNVSGVNAPASDPYVLGVGGNQSPVSAGVTNPVSWADSSNNNPGVSGGGISAKWPLPAYQAGLSGAQSSSQRNVPDLALPAVADDVLVHASDSLWDGTSWSSSIATALFAQTVEICGSAGFANPRLYQAFGTYGEGSVFLDVTSGTNTYLSFPGYKAAKGYDNVSGIGMPGGIKFAAAMCGTTTVLTRAKGM